MSKNHLSLEAFLRVLLTLVPAALLDLAPNTWGGIETYTVMVFTNSPFLLSTAPCPVLNVAFLSFAHVDSPTPAALHQPVQLSAWTGPVDWMGTRQGQLSPPLAHVLRGRLPKPPPESKECLNQRAIA